MSAQGRASLYTPDLLALAVSLARYPLDPASPHLGRARSVTCGSEITFGAALGVDGAITRGGLRVSACAVGQAAAAVFIASAPGRTRADVARAREAIAAWLGGEDPLPDWPGFSVLGPAKAFPGRHGAILLAWDAALDALSNSGEAG